MNKTWEKEYSIRYRLHANELKWLYCELYHNDMGAYDYFTEMLYRMWLERPEKLKMKSNHHGRKILTSSKSFGKNIFCMMNKKG